MKKIMIIGCPGSGKSTFSKKLHNLTSIPLYHLDMIYWKSDRTTVPNEIFINKLENILNKASFIIDGNYSSTIEMRLKVCDTVFFLDYPTEICLSGIYERMGKKRDDMPWIESDEDVEFTQYIKNFNSTVRPKIIELITKYKHKNIIILKSREEAENYLNSI